MPTYQYQCTSCAHSFEIMQKMTVEPLRLCPQCNKEELRKIPTAGIGLSLSGRNAPSGGCCPCGKNSCSS